MALRIMTVINQSLSFLPSSRHRQLQKQELKYKRKRNITEAEKQARWPPVEELPTVKPSDQEVIKIARDRKLRDQGEMCLGI